MQIVTSLITLNVCILFFIEVGLASKCMLWENIDDKIYNDSSSISGNTSITINGMLYDHWESSTALLSLTDPKSIVVFNLTCLRSYPNISASIELEINFQDENVRKILTVNDFTALFPIRLAGNTLQYNSKTLIISTLLRLPRLTRTIFHGNSIAKLFYINIVPNDSGV